jgi:hypothetical protein
MNTSRPQELQESPRQLAGSLRWVLLLLAFVAAQSACESPTDERKEGPVGSTEAAEAGSQTATNGVEAGATTINHTNGVEPGATTINHIIFLTHPAAWSYFALHPDQYCTGCTAVPSWGGYTIDQLVAMEDVVVQRWLEAIRTADSNTAIAVNGMSSEHLASDVLAPLLQAIQQYMPGRNVVTVQNPTESVGPFVVRTLENMGAALAPQVTWEAWGQSSEGCGMYWAGHVAAGLGIDHGIRLNYPMTFPDAWFAMTANFLEQVTLGGTDVSCYLSEQAATGAPFALCIPGVIHDDETPGTRYVSLTGSPSSVYFTDLAGNLQVVPYVGDGYRMPLNYWTAEPMLYIWAGEGTSLHDFRAALAASTIADG